VRRAKVRAALAAGALFVAGAARAAEVQRAQATGPGVLQAEPAGQQMPQLGVDEQPRRGVYAETSLGVFTTAGGDRALSIAQAYLGMAVGRDLGDRAAVFLQLGIGASSASCFDATATRCLGADSFGVSYVELGLKYGAKLLPRLRLSGMLVSGLTVLSPSPIYDSKAGSVPDKVLGPHGGAGLALDYDTHLDHFAVGVDLLGRYSVTRRPGGGSFSLLSFAGMPRIKYVF
jgi:hypothetical protein